MKNSRKDEMLPDAMGWLDGAGASFLNRLSEHVRRVSLSGGEVYTRAEDPTGGLTGIVSGRVDLHLPTVRQGRTLVHAFGPGWWLGDLSAISGEARLFDQKAALPSKLLRLSRDEMLRICNEYPNAWRHLAIMASENMRLTISIAAQYRLESPNERVASCLLRLDRTGMAWDGRLPISQTDLASIADMSRRRLISALDCLERQAVIKREYRAVQIVDRKKLLLACG